MNSKASVDEHRRRVAASLQVGNPSNHARDLPALRDPPTDCQLELTVDQIQPYEHNPRRASNAKFDDIKESIRTSGLRTPLTVTRRPGESHFIVEAGGNTRLLALQQLWAETRDPRFRDLVVLFRPWRSETHVLTAHLIENEQRGDLTFWDKAAGVVALKDRLEAEQGRALSLRPLEDALYGLGLSVNPATLAHYRFARERLRTLGAAVTDLSGLDVKTLQPRLNALKRYAQTRASMTEDELYAQIIEPVFLQIAGQYPHTRTFSVAATCAACENALTRHLGENVDALRQGTARGSEGDPVSRTPNAANTVTAGSAPAVSGTVPGRATGSPMDGFRNCVRAFAALTGLSGYVEPMPDVPTGYRFAALPLTDPGSPARQRAWWLLAGVCGQLEPDAILPVSFDGAFLTWLADPGDAAATAFWAVLTALRQARSASSRLCTGDDSISTPGEL